jgi:hypothetical protein
MKKKIVFLDMDGPLFDFRKGVGRDPYEQDPPEMFALEFFRNLPVQSGARWAVSELLACDYLDVYIATKPTTKTLHIRNGKGYYPCHSEKVGAIAEHFPELLKKMFIVPDKLLLRGDFLIDDDKRWEKFPGMFIHFDERDPERSWKHAVARIKVSADPARKPGFFDKAHVGICKCEGEVCVCCGQVW